MINFNQLSTIISTHWIKVKNSDELVMEEKSKGVGGKIRNFFFKIAEYFGAYKEYHLSEVARVVANRCCKPQIALSLENAKSAILFLEVLKNTTHTETEQEAIELSICRVLQRCPELIVGEIGTALSETDAIRYQQTCEGFGSTAAASQNICLVQTSSYGQWTIKYDVWPDKQLYERSFSRDKSRFFLQYEFSPNKEKPIDYPKELVPYTPYEGPESLGPSIVQEERGMHWNDGHPAHRLYLTDEQATHLIKCIPADNRRLDRQHVPPDHRNIDRGSIVEK